MPLKFHSIASCTINKNETRVINIRDFSIQLDIFHYHHLLTWGYRFKSKVSHPLYVHICPVSKVQKPRFNLTLSLSTRKTELKRHSNLSHITSISLYLATFHDTLHTYMTPTVQNTLYNTNLLLGAHSNAMLLY